MYIELVQRNQFHTAYEIPAFIESLVLFDRSTEILTVHNHTQQKYVVTLYTPSNTYINFLYGSIPLQKKSNNDDDGYAIYLESREFIRGIVRRNVEGYKYFIELSVDHDINEFKNDCSLAENEVSDTIVRYMLELNTHKTHDTLKKTEISDLQQESKTLHEKMENPLSEMIRWNHELLNLRYTIGTLDTQLIDSDMKLKVIRAIIGAIIVAFISHKLRPYFLHWRAF